MQKISSYTRAGCSLLYEQALKLLSPPCCAYCKTFLPERAVFCASCTKLLQPVVSVMLPVTTTKSIKVFASSMTCINFSLPSSLSKLSGSLPDGNMAVLTGMPCSKKSSIPRIAAFDPAGSESNIRITSFVYLFKNRT